MAAGRPVVVMSTEACNTVWKVFCVMSNVRTRFTDCPAATVPASIVCRIKLGLGRCTSDLIWKLRQMQ